MSSDTCHNSDPTECNRDQCQNGGICSSAAEGFICGCLTGFAGAACEEGKSRLYFSPSCLTSMYFKGHNGSRIKWSLKKIIKVILEIILYLN